MNANELADALDDVVANYIQMIADVDFSDVATMLRQQEVEIERVVSKYEEMIRQQQDEIEALKEALEVKVILNEHAQQSIKEVKGLLRKEQEK